MKTNLSKLVVALGITSLATGMTQGFAAQSLVSHYLEIDNTPPNVIPPLFDSQKGEYVPFMEVNEISHMEPFKFSQDNEWGNKNRCLVISAKNTRPVYPNPITGEDHSPIREKFLICMNEHYKNILWRSLMNKVESDTKATGIIKQLKDQSDFINIIEEGALTLTTKLQKAFETSTHPFKFEVNDLGIYWAFQDLNSNNFQVSLYNSNYSAYTRHPSSTFVKANINVSIRNQETSEHEFFLSDLIPSALLDKHVTSALKLVNEPRETQIKLKEESYMARINSRKLKLKDLEKRLKTFSSDSDAVKKIALENVIHELRNWSGN